MENEKFGENNTEVAVGDSSSGKVSFETSKAEQTYTYTRPASKYDTQTLYYDSDFELDYDSEFEPDVIFTVDSDDELFKESKPGLFARFRKNNSAQNKSGMANESDTKVGFFKSVKFKNIVAAAIIILMLLCVFLTMRYAVKNTSASIGTTGINSDLSSDAGGSVPSDLGDSVPSDISDIGGSSIELPDSSSLIETISAVAWVTVDTDSGVPDLPDGDIGDTTVPDLPDGDVGDTTVPNIPDTTELPENDGESLDDSSAGEITVSTASADLSGWYYIIFGVEAFVIALAVMYLVMSRANKKSVREVFVNRDKIKIFVLSVALITIISSLVLVQLTELWISSASSDSSTDTVVSDSSDSSSGISYSAVLKITENTEMTSGNYESTSSDENVIWTTGDITVSLSNMSIVKTGDTSDSGDSSNFYGTNSGIIATDGANLTLSNLSVTTDADGANGIFSYGGSATTSNTSTDGTTVTISDSTINTTGDNSGGIMTTGGGIMYAYDLTVTTSGISSAAIRTDRGGGTVVVDGGTYTTNGAGSPAVYSTADITVTDATLISNSAEGVVIEGKNSVTLEDCDLTDNNSVLNGQSTTYKNIFIYQSASGDADEGEGTFTATDCKITTNEGDTFYITNTTAVITLEDNDIINNDSDGYFLRAQADSWGESGSNGGDVTLNMIDQDVSGDIYIDSISTLVMNLSDDSSFKGCINGDNTAKSITLTLDKDSTLTLTGDTYVTNLEDEDSDYSNINFNGYKLYVDGKAIN